MREELQDIIREARVALRTASGQPMSVEEQEEADRKLQIGEMNECMMRRFKVPQQIWIGGTTVWTEGGPAFQFELDKRIFRLRQHRDTYMLLEVMEQQEEEILSLPQDDSQFANRVIVAMADRFPPGK